LFYLRHFDIQALQCVWWTWIRCPRLIWQFVLVALDFTSQMRPVRHQQAMHLQPLTMIQPQLQQPAETITPGQYCVLCGINACTRCKFGFVWTSAVY